MATTFEEEYQKALGERGLAIVSKRTAIQMKRNAEKRRDNLEQVLFGDETNYGIVSILSIMYNQIWHITGQATSKPLLHNLSYAKNQYQANFALSVTPSGDGIGGLHPPQPDNPDAGQDDVDPNSIWLTDHALEIIPSGTGAVQLLDDLSKIIGVTASADSNGRGPYSSQTDAQMQVAVNRGSGMLGYRTENSEIYSTGIAPNMQWWIGQNGIDTPDNYAQKSNLISALSDVQNKLNSLMIVLQQECSLLNGDNGAILQEFKVELPNDTGLDNFMVQINDFIIKIQKYSDYFNQFNNPSPPEKRAEINAMLAEVLSYATTIQTTLNNRVTSILSEMLGNASSGTRKHLTFWITEVVKKPEGPYAMIFAANDMLNQTQINLSNKNNRLIFFSADFNKWIETPSIQSIYDRAVMNLDQETVNRWETGIIWNLILSANKYKLLYKPLSQMTLPLNNDLWNESSGVWVVDMMPTTFLRNILTITPPTETTFFRLIAYDTLQGDAGDFDRIDSFDTNSVQSDIVSDIVPFVQIDDTATRQSVIEVDDSVGLRVRDFLWVNASEIAQIMGVIDNQYALDTNYGKIGQIQKLFGLYYKEPLLTE